MKWKHWNYFRTGLLTFSQALLTAILVDPWLKSIPGYHSAGSERGFYWILISAFAIILAVRLRPSETERGSLAFLLVGGALPLLLIGLWQLSLWVYLPLTLVLFLFAARFCEYFGRHSYAADLSWGSLIMVLSTLIWPEQKLSSILFFFGAALASLVLRNAADLEERNRRPDYRGMARSIPAFFLATLFSALFFGSILSPSVLQKALAVLGKGYYYLSEAILFLIVKPWAWLMSPLFRWLENFESQPVPLELPEGVEHLVSGPQKTFGAETTQIAIRGAWLVGLVAFVFLLWLVFRRFSIRKRQERQSLPEDFSESVFSSAEIWQNLKNAFAGLTRPWPRQRGGGGRYRGEDPIRLIRLYYARFARKMSKTVDYQKGATPREYEQRVISARENANEEALDTLTKLYNEARYGERGDQSGAKSARKALREVF